MKFQNTYETLPNNFFADSTPAVFSNPALLAYNEELAEELGIDLKKYSEKELAEIFSGQKLLEGSRTISMVYAAHQFGGFVPQLGDGRAMLLGEVVNSQEKRFDVQLKGSGPTVFSRNGDGMSALGPVVREYIVSEAMYHLGVPTTRALAAVNTGDVVYRRGEEPGGVFTRVAASHIRIGTFQYFANKGDLDGLMTLLDYSIKRHYPEILEGAPKNFEGMNLGLLFLQSVVESQLSLVSSWMSLGFIHGVMNTDNTTVSGETIDFGPCAFMDRFEFNKVFSSIDRGGRYSYENQRYIVAWNLCRLADCLIPLVDPKPDKAVDILNAELEKMSDTFDEKWLTKMAAKLGLTVTDKTKEEDKKLVNSFLELLENNSMDFTLSFRNLADILDADKQKKDLLFKPSEEFSVFEKNWLERLKQEKGGTAKIQEKMNSVNPRYIPRNHQVQRAIEGAYEGDLTVFHELNKVLKNPFTYQADLDRYSVAPLPQQEIRATFCGT